MKRFICLLVLAAASVSAGMCAISTKDMTNSTYMNNQGYSKETIRIVNNQIYKPKAAREEENLAYKFWQKFNSYIDPAYDNGQFGYSEIQFKNKWDEF